MAIAAALHAARQLDLAHQDLMPDKSPTTRDGVLKVADFRRDRVNNPWCFSSRKKSLARWSYLAPEQLRGEKHLTQDRSLFPRLPAVPHAGRAAPVCCPHTGSAARQAPHRNSSPPVPWPSIAPFGSTLVAQLLEKDPLRRPHSAEAVGLALAEAKKKAASGVSVAQHALGGFSTLRMPADKHEARKLFGGRRSVKKPRTKARRFGSGPGFWVSPSRPCSPSLPAV